MTTFLTGRIYEVQTIERTNKDTGKVSYLAQVTVHFETRNNNGKKVLSVENVPFDIDELDKLEAAMDKYIAIPYNTINTKNGTYTFPDDNLSYVILDKNPFETKTVPAADKKTA